MAGANEPINVRPLDVFDLHAAYGVPHVLGGNHSRQVEVHRRILGKSDSWLENTKLWKYVSTGLATYHKYLSGFWCFAHLLRFVIPIWTEQRECQVTN